MTFSYSIEFLRLSEADMLFQTLYLKTTGTDYMKRKNIQRNRTEDNICLTIKDFMVGYPAILDDCTHLRNFYNYMKSKYKIPCETGMCYIEYAVTNDLFRRYKERNKMRNVLLNKKMNLYVWISPKHLGIDIEIGIDVIENAKAIEAKSSPQEKLDKFMETVKMVYTLIEKTSGPDLLISGLVYVFLKSQVKDLYSHLKYIMDYRRPYGGDCDCVSETDIFLSGNTMPQNSTKDEEDVEKQINPMTWDLYNEDSMFLMKDRGTLKELLKCRKDIVVKKRPKEYFGCHHGFPGEIVSQILINPKPWDDVYEYYLLSGLLAVEFIEKIEYESLSIDIKEYDKEILSRIDTIHL